MKYVFDDLIFLLFNPFTIIMIIMGLGIWLDNSSEQERIISKCEATFDEIEHILSCIRTFKDED